MKNVNDDLKKLGWNLSKEGIDLCKEELAESNQKAISADDVIKAALNIDLSNIGEAILPDGLSKGKINEFSGPCVLQITKVRNISAPKANEESSVAPRLLQLHLTDGHKSCICIENDSFDKKLNLDTPPGSKVCLNGTVKLQNGFLLLNSRNITLLGGIVESIYNKWKTAKEVGGFSRIVANGEDVPPPFVPFGKKITYQCNTSARSLQKSEKNDKIGNGDKIFNEQRETAIAKVKETMADTHGKSFTTGKTNLNHSSNGPDMQYSNKQAKVSSYQRYLGGNDSKLDQSKVNDAACEQIVQMGFSHSAAVSALRRHNNNVERALEDLLPSSEGQNDNSRVRSNRGARTGGNRGRGGRKSYRDRNEDKYNESDPQSQASSATLFDYVESKMIKKSKAKTSDRLKKPSTNEKNPSNSVDDDALQEEYILEYVKELSLVETSGRNADQNFEVGNADSHSSNVKSDNDGVSKYRSGKSFRSNTNNKPDQTNANRHSSSRGERSTQSKRKDSEENRSKAREPFHSKTFIQSSRQTKYDSNDSNVEANFVDGDKKQTNRYESKTYNRSQSKTGYQDASSDSQNHVHGDGRQNFRKSTNKNKQEKRPLQYQRAPLPPRFQKQMQENHDNQQVDHQPSTGDFIHRGNPNIRSSQSYVIYDSNNNTQPLLNHPSASYSYSNQRQQGINSIGASANQPITENARWRPGMFCQARYWEDGQFYRALVIDIHNSEPTAVVQFVGYGNSEEVYFVDMRPDRNTVKRPLIDRIPPFIDNSSINESYPNRRNERRTPARPTQSLYHPPVPK